MFIDRRDLIRAAASALVLGPAASLGVRAQALKTATMLVGFPGGSGPDILARRVADKLKPGFAETVIVDNRTGAGGQLAITAIKTMPADGSAILLTPMAMLGVYPFTYKKLPYDPIADLAPVSMAVTFDVAFAVGPAVPASVRTVPEFMAWAKANPGGATFGSPAAGSPLHFTGIMLGKAAGVELTHAAYRGSVAAIPDILGGRLPALVTPVGETLAHLGEGKLRVLGTSGAKRNRFLPQVSTFAEQGFKDIAFSEWFGFFVPAKTPPEVVARLNAAIHQALTAPDFVEALNPMGLDPAPTTPAELGAALQEAQRRWGPVVKSIGFSADS